jgi:hypothetical protein
MIGRFVPLDGGHDTSIVYLNLSDSMIRFTIPVLRNQVTYAMQIIREPGSNPIRGTSRGPASTVDPDRDAALMKGGRDQVFNRSSLPGCTVASSEQLIYVYHFRTSRYDRLSDKLQSWIPHHVQNLVLSNHKEIQTVTFRTIEPIDRFDAMGYDYQIAGTDAHVDPLITLSASDRSSAWHTAFTNPWIYDPLAALMKGGREQLATPADDGSSARAGGAGTSFELAQQKFSASPLIEYDSSYVYKLEDSEIQHTHLSAGGGTDDPSSVVHSRQASADSVEIRLLYRQGVIIPEDFERVQKLAAQQRSSSYSSTLKSEDRIWLERLLVQKYQPMPPGPYTIRFKYGVTGGDHAVSANTSTSLPQRDSTIEKTFSILR